MKKYRIKIEYEGEVEAKDKDRARNKFWEEWGEQLALSNRTIMTELSDSIEVEEINGGDK